MVSHQKIHVKVPLGSKKCYRNSRAKLFDGATSQKLVCLYKCICPINIY